MARGRLLGASSLSFLLFTLFLASPSTAHEHNMGNSKIVAGDTVSPDPIVRGHPSSAPSLLLSDRNRG